MVRVKPLPFEVEELGRVILVPRTSIRPFADQPRKYFNQLELQQLAASIKKVGQKVPALVRELSDDETHCYELVDGQRRWHALDMAGIMKMKVIVMDVKDADEQFLISVVANFRSEHAPMEIVNAIARFKSQGMSVAEIAQIFAWSVPWVYQHLKIAEKLHPDVKRMMSPELPEDDRLTFSMALSVADVPQNLQLKIAQTIVSKGLKVLQAKDYIRRQGEKQGFAVGNPERTPNKDYVVLCNFNRKLRRDVDVFTHYAQEFFTRIFEHRNDEDRLAMLQMLLRNIEGLKILKDALEKAKKQ